MIDHCNLCDRYHEEGIDCPPVPKPTVYHVTGATLNGMSPFEIELLQKLDKLTDVIEKLEVRSRPRIRPRGPGGGPY